MIGVKCLRIVSVALVTVVVAACSEAGVPSGSVEVPTPPAPTSTGLVTNIASAPAPTLEPTRTPTPEVAFRALDTPADYSRSGAEAVDGTTAVGWVQTGKSSEPERPAVWDTTTGALRVLEFPAEFIHPNGDTFVRLEGISGTTAIGTGILGAKSKRGQERVMVWNLETGDLRILDIPAGFKYAQASAISGTTVVGQVRTADEETTRPAAWDTETGAVRILKVPAPYSCSVPEAISGDTVVGIGCVDDHGHPLVWNPLTAEARGLDMLQATQDGTPLAVDGTTAVGSCCYGEDGTTRPLVWDTRTGSVRELTLPAEFEYGRADGVSGTLVIGDGTLVLGTRGPRSTMLIWDLATGQARVLPLPEGHDSSHASAVSGRTVVGSACEVAPSPSAPSRCVAAAWTLP